MRYLLWPALMVASIAAAAIGFDRFPGYYGSIGVLAAVLLGLALIVLIAERVCPRDAVDRDAQLPNDIGYIALSGPAGGLGELLANLALLPVAKWLADWYGASLWPAWPLAASVALGLVVAELGSYWQHRVFHEWPRMWRFHSLHHDPEHLYFVKAYRLHPFEFMVIPLVAYPPLILLGAPRHVFDWYVLMAGAIGILAHANLDMRTGFVSFVFNTPDLHRLHHSIEPRQANTNYTTSLVLWDLVFGTFINPMKEQPDALGIHESPVPDGFVRQLTKPFGGKP